MLWDKVLILFPVGFRRIMLNKYHAVRIDPKGLGYPGGNMAGTAADGHFAVRHIGNNY